MKSVTLSATIGLTMRNILLHLMWSECETILNLLALCAALPAHWGALSWNYESRKPTNNYKLKRVKYHQIHPYWSRSSSLLHRSALAVVTAL